MQKSSSECTPFPTLKKMCYCSRIPYLVPHLKTKERELKVKFDGLTKNWIIKDWKMLHGLASMVKNGWKKYGVLSMVQAGGVMMYCKGWFPGTVCLQLSIVLMQQPD